MDDGEDSESGRLIVEHQALRNVGPVDVAGLLSSVACYLDKRAEEIAEGLDNVESQEGYVVGYRDGLLGGLAMAANLVSVLCDRTDVTGSPWISHHPLNEPILTPSSSLSP